MRPRPMKPHVARFEGVEAKERLVIEDSEDAEGPLPSMQSREGENRIETAALMLTYKEMWTDGGNDEKVSITWRWVRERWRVRQSKAGEGSREAE